MWIGSRLPALLIALLSVNARATEYQFDAENAYFDQHRTTARSHIQKFYDEAQILLLGAANHRNFQHHLHLIDLLNEVGRDPKLRFLVLEQSHDNAEFYRELSTTPLEEVLKTHAFPSEHARMLSLCWSREWAYVYTHVFLVAQTINKARPADNPLMVIALDGFSTSSAYGLHSDDHVISWDCTFSTPELWNNMADVQNREISTAQNFTSRSGRR
jgi:hypothetical protein